MNWTMLWAKIHKLEQASGGGSGGGLSVVELTTIITTEGAALSAEEGAKLDEMAAIGLPFVLKCQTDDAYYSTIINCMGMDGTILAFSAQISDVGIMLAPTETGWMGLRALM